METKWVVKCEPAGPGNYRINGMTTLKKDYYITGAFWTADHDSVCITAKYDEDGNLLWHNTYEPENSIITQGCAVHALTQELVDITHEIFVLARIKDSKGLNTVALIKYDSFGNIQWDKSIKRSRKKINSVLLNDYMNDLYIAGWFEVTENSKEIFIAKYHPSGNLVWQSKYRNKALLYDTLCFCLGKNGQFLMAGAAEFSNRFFYIRYDRLGNFINLIEYETSGSKNSIADILTDNSGNVYILGTSYNNKTGKDYLILVYDECDSLILEQSFDGPAHKDDIACALIIDTSVEDTVYVFALGSSMSETGIEEVLTVKYDLGGEQLWTKTFKGRKNECAEPVLRSPRLIYPSSQMKQTNYYITGYVGDDILILKQSTKGFISWFTRYSVPCAVNRPTAYHGYGVTIESKTEKGLDAYLMKFGKAEQLGIIRWD